MAGEHGGEDECAEPAAFPVLIGLQKPHPAGVELEFLAGAAVGDGDCEPAFAEPQLLVGEPVQGRVTYVESLPQEELAHLGQPDAVPDQAGNLLPVLTADRPSLPAGTTRACSPGGQDLREPPRGQ